MDNNIKNNGSEIEKHQRDNNRNHSGNYNRNRNNSNRNYSEDNKLNANKNGEGSKNKRSSDTSNKPRNNNSYNNGKPRYKKNNNGNNRASFSENAENKKTETSAAKNVKAENIQSVKKNEYSSNRNKNNNRNSGNRSKTGEHRASKNSTRSKGYYMSKSIDNLYSKGIEDYEFASKDEYLGYGKGNVKEVSEKNCHNYDASSENNKQNKNLTFNEFFDSDNEKQIVEKKELMPQKDKPKGNKISDNGKTASKKTLSNAMSEKLDRSPRAEMPELNSKSEDERLDKNTKISGAAVTTEPKAEKFGEKDKSCSESDYPAKPVKRTKTDRDKTANNAKSAGYSEEESNYAENRRKSETRFWVRMFSLMVIIPVYAALVICMFAMPRSTVSNIEKRNLAVFPEFSWEDYWSGTYTGNITHYFDDTVPFRDTLKQAGSQLLKFLGIKYNNVQVSGQMQVINNVDNDVSDDSNKVSDNKKPDISAETSSHEKDTDTEEVKPKGQEIADGVYTNGTIVVYQDGHYRGMAMYGGGTGDAYVDSVNKFAEDLPGVRVYSMVDPTSGEFYTPLNFSDYNASQSDDIESINSRLTNVIGINVCPVLEKHLNEPIYTRTDHHWMSLGAYYAAQTFAKEAGVSFKDIREYEKKSNPDYVGTLYSFSDNNANLLNDPEDFIYYVPKVKNYKTEYYDYAYNFVYEGDLFADVVSNSELYCTFLGGDAYTVKITTGVKNGRKLCVVKDSYGNALIPFFTGSFEEIYVVDMRYFELNLVDFVQKQGVTDLLFSCCSYSAVGTNADNLEVLRTMGGSVTSDNEDYDGSDESSDDDIDSASSEDYSESEGNDNALPQSGDTDVYDDDNNDDYFNDIVTDDGQLGIVGNIYDNNNDDDVGYEDYGYGDDYYY